MEDRTCEWCGEMYTPVREFHRFCSGRCQHARWLHLNQQHHGPPRPCDECGSYLNRKKIDARFCSDKCSKAAGRRRGDAAERAQAHRKWKSQLPACVVVGCSTVAISKDPGLCSKHYHRLRRYGSLDLPDIFCGRCGCGPLVRSGGQPPKFCPDCKRLNMLEDALYREHMRRTVYSTGDKITLPELGERDGWRCHLCGKKVRQRTGQDRLSPSIDHLIPVSAEGAHVWENVALAHKGCNSSRNNRGAAQLRLIA